MASVEITVVATFLEENFENRARESAYDAFKRAGLIGIVHDGPTDLSTNPDYLMGLGK